VSTAAPVRLRTFQPADIPAGLRLSQAAGWNQLAADWQALLSLGSDTFVAAECEGRVVGTGGAACYGAHLAWVCMILVAAEHRGRGLGTRLVEEAVARSGTRVIGLDATPMGQPVYERLGFRASGLLLRLSAAPARASQQREAVTPLDRTLPTAVLAWDQEVFGADRADMLRWLAGHGRGFVAGSPDAPDGYAFLRPGHHSRHVGPVVAKDAATAETLVRAALAAAGDGPILIDAPAADPAWLARLSALGFVEKRRLTRMYKAPGGPLGQPARQWAILGPEFS
jgi:[ribosomal protein S18]-alanine N-acetyltransferase